MFKMPLPDDVLYIIDRMHSHGYSAHVVGGSVRDSLLGRDLGDFDITTNALPEQTKTLFSEHRTVDTGIKHGTVTLVLGGTPYEITTYRIDGDYKDNRHPDSVKFTSSLLEDLARRDFTVNAMAYNPDSGLTDPFSGRDDAKIRLIRAVGDPYLRFDEDALRILRALRFASVLDFTIEENTAGAAKKLAGRLTSISKERVYTELKKLINGDNAYGVIEKYPDVLIYALEGLEIKRLPKKELFDRADYLTRLSSLIYLNSPEPIDTATGILESLKTDKFTRTHVISVLKAYEDIDFTDEQAVLTMLMKHGEQTLGGALKLGVSLGRFADREQELFSSALSSGKPYTISHLAVRGTDLTALGIAGEKVGQTLKTLLCAVINDEVDNEKSALIRYLGSVI